MIVAHDPKRPVAVPARALWTLGVPLQLESVMIMVGCLSRLSMHPLLHATHERQRKLAPALYQGWVLIHTSHSNHGIQPFFAVIGSGWAGEVTELIQTEGNDFIP